MRRVAHAPGTLQDATQQLDGRLTSWTTPRERRAIEALQGEIAFKQGSISQSIAIYESGLRRLGSGYPDHGLDLR